ncbi:MAG TPA: tRNA uridine-5-carboxymethylaminomethyl(34) synthesis GTPase MnmE [Steroidobacteraceae bacterium]|nr:tRNA uridine-5-carboxymethylaminomethyl(34) synthesis GTPase MnmE [Steroidobacteraceae bacterium]
MTDPSATQNQTIVAAATPPGRGGIAIVRLSGPLCTAIALSVLGRLPPPRHATPSRFLAADGAALDEGLALYFPAPHSYTGEDVLELHGHGGALLVESLIARAVALGARRAQPGEFTLRAYLNEKLDLAQAEAVADLIDAGSEAAARAALRSLQGEFSARVRTLDEALAEVRAHVEATIDFPTDEIDYLADRALTERLAAVRELCAALQATARQGRLLTEGLTVVIAGAPNAGKSTLLNRLAGHDAAIVTDIPGTTRDVLRERIQLEGVPLLLLDTAGLRDSRDAIEAEGMRRARAAMAQADHVLFLVDALRDPGAAGYEAERARIPPQVPVTILFNKIDLLTDRASGARVLPSLASVPQLQISASTGAGLEELRRHLLEAAGYRSSDSGALSARRRHLEALALTAAHLEHAERQCREAGAGELVAEELRAAQRSLGEITGAGTAEELLGRIFSAFCIGK